MKNYVGDSETIFTRARAFAAPEFAQWLICKTGDRKLTKVYISIAAFQNQLRNELPKDWRVFERLPCA
jgi:hypothetical protein